VQPRVPESAGAGGRFAVEWTRLLPFLRWRELITARSTRADLLAGITGAIIVLPQGVAFAMIAGLPPEYGLYSAIVPAMVAALFGSSHHLISGPTTAISIVVFTTIAPHAEPGSAEYIRMVLTLTFMAGAFQLALGLARLGALVNFISHSVVVGFTAGAALLIGTSQMSTFLGIPGTKQHAFIHIWENIFRHLPEANPAVLTVSAVTLATAVLFKVFLPRLPGLLLAMIAGSVAAAALHGGEHGVRLVGSLPGRLPPLSWPDLSTAAVRNLAPGALAVALLGLVEAVSIARSVATRSHQRIDSNQEFVGQGLSNLVGSFFSSYASSGSFTRSGLNFAVGAQTPMAAVYAALALGAVLLLIAPLTAYLPMAAMAAVLLVVAAGLVDVHHIRTIARTSRPEAVVLAVTLVTTLVAELEFAIYVGVLLSLVLYLNRTAHPRFITLVPDPERGRKGFVNVLKKPAPECPQLKIVRIDGSVFFGAVSHVAEQLDLITRADPEQAHILVVGGGINFIDVAGCEMFAEEARRLRLEGRTLYLCLLKGEVLELLRRGSCVARVGEDNLFRSKAEAVRKLVLTRLDPERCRVCRVRIFNECARMPGAAPAAAEVFEQAD
jgi:SulP family sulfate permease